MDDLDRDVFVRSVHSLVFAFVDFFVFIRFRFFLVPIVCSVASFEFFSFHGKAMLSFMSYAVRYFGHFL